jgi:hypothetical protein
MLIPMVVLAPNPSAAADFAISPSSFEKKLRRRVTLLSGAEKIYNSLCICFCYLIVIFLLKKLILSQFHHQSPTTLSISFIKRSVSLKATMIF